MKRWLVRLAILLGVFVVAAVSFYLVKNEPRPTGTPGPRADALAKKIQQATGQDAWAKTGFVRFNFAGRHSHIWDRTRGLHQIEWKNIVVQHAREGDATRVLVDGAESSLPSAADHKKDAITKFFNDTYWLNPFVGLFDATTKRSIVETKDGPALLVEYGAGGSTPGDAYLISVDDKGLPKSWKMWVSIVPMGGMEVSFERWMTLPTGAKVSTLHVGPATLELKDIVGAQRLSDIHKDDPFAQLLGKEKGTATSTAAPASRPAE